ncbi:DUF4044 domain-containing protein [Facklamia sp. DSM 111018]|uniref:DUF4044 domain-containing protein n=1 Tax=Facklamia lactis TaxID=2749967 RepID=A0ABS0LNY8_9LACT|nr:DUF4044 domain-containing protein [Facklamia lactis]MBG9985866.1 DUF4044 domain-containing protein [Facklamia lactis]
MKYKKNKKSKYDRLIKIMAILMIFTMVIGLVLTLVLTITNYFN